MSMVSLKNQIAVVTGGSKGIGKAIAFAFAENGCKVAISARHAEELEAAAKEISARGVEVLPLRADVRNPSDVEQFAKAVQNRWGAPHYLVNNAGIGVFSDVASMKDEDFAAVMETNLFGVFYCTRRFLPGMIEQQRGHIVNISSLAGKNSFAGGSVYCASKHGLIGFSECLMLEVRHHNIKVTTICPGSVQTSFSPEMKDRSWALTAEDVAKVVIDVVTSSAGAMVSLVEMRPQKPKK
jgi:3-oxoacyl-[acyl-carrier protein] reductase